MKRKGVIPKPKQEEKGPTGNNYVLAISIDQYEYAPPLSNCVRDAEAFIEILTSKYNFEHKKDGKQLIFHLSNKSATHKKINKKLTELKSKVTPNDNLIIYFSGHGETEDNTGFWIPVEAHPEEETEFISTDEIKRKLNAINSFHTFLLIDACFSGSLFLNYKNIKAGVASKPSRWGLAASHSKEVALDGTPGENSPFAKSLLKTLKESTKDLSILELSTSLIQDVSRDTENKQIPVFQPIDIKGHKEGQYVFHLKEDKEAKLIAEFEIDLKEGVALIETGKTKNAKRYLNGLLKEVKEEIQNTEQQKRLSQLIQDQLEICKNIPKYKPIFEKILGTAALAKQEITEKEKQLKFLKTQLEKAEAGIKVQQKKEEGLKNNLVQKDKKISELEKALTREQTNHKKATASIATLQKQIAQLKEVIKNNKRKETSTTINGLQDKIGTIPIEMIPIKGGTFQLGGEVTLDDYYIAKYPVTQELWEAVMGNNPAKFKGSPKNPVEKVSWDDAQKFIKKLNKKTGKKYRLPTEAEWEFAARGGNQSKGFKYAGSNNIEEVAWYEKNSNNQTQPVGQKKANELELQDMSGNVWEWCQDWYEDYPSSARKNPQGPKSGSDRVLRGGSWGSSAGYCRVSNRINSYPGNRLSNDGFRIAHS